MDYSGRSLVGLLLIVFGLSAFFDLNIWHLFWPLVIIFIGWKILNGHSHHSHGTDKEPSTSDQNNFEYSAIFNELNKKIDSKELSRGKVSVIFGGGTLDLRQAKIAKGEVAYLELEIVFGGIRVIVPDSWSVTSSVVGVLGGFSNQTKVPSAKGEQGRLVIKGSAVFGGGEVVNG